MKTLRVATIGAILLLLGACTSTQKIKTRNGISEMQYLEIGGIKQFVLIRGIDKNKPLLLLLHGGPGASETALFRKFNGELEKYFTVVYWDQRGAGKSYSKDLKKEDISVKQYIEDAHQLTAYLQKRFNREKIYLIGHSWGSRLGLYLIDQKPENYYAYLGVGQELQSYRGELLSYRYTLEKAKEVQNRKAIKELEEMGEPSSGDYTQMYRTGFWGLVRQKHWLLKLGGEFHKETSYAKWIKTIWLSREYSMADLVRYSKGSAFSAGSAIYDPDFNHLNFFQTIPAVEVPVYFISGASDYNTPWTIVEEYYHHLKAPAKEFILFDQSGHSPPFEEPERFNREVLRLFIGKEKIGSALKQAQ
jgi:proline iminopeptidase